MGSRWHVREAHLFANAPIPAFPRERGKELVTIGIFLRKDHKFSEIVNHSISLIHQRRKMQHCRKGFIKMMQQRAPLLVLR
jgi:hypothetical protein